MCLSRSKSSAGNGSPINSAHCLTLSREHLHAHDQVPHELALIGVGERPVIRQLVDLADVVQEDAGQEQVAVDLGVEIDDPVGHVEQRHDVLDQPPLVGMVVLDPRRGER